MIGIVINPAMTSSVPAAASQSNLNMRQASRPCHWTAQVQPGPGEHPRAVGQQGLHRPDLRDAEHRDDDQIRRVGAGHLAVAGPRRRRRDRPAPPPRALRHPVRNRRDLSSHGRRRRPAPRSRVRGVDLGRVPHPQEQHDGAGRTSEATMSVSGAAEVGRPRTATTRTSSRTRSWPAAGLPEPPPPVDDEHQGQRHERRRGSASAARPSRRWSCGMDRWRVASAVIGEASAPKATGAVFAISATRRRLERPEAQRDQHDDGDRHRRAEAGQRLQQRTEAEGDDDRLDPQVGADPLERAAEHVEVAGRDGEVVDPDRVDDDPQDREEAVGRALAAGQQRPATAACRRPRRRRRSRRPARPGRRSRRAPAAHRAARTA